MPIPGFGVRKTLVLNMEDTIISHTHTIGKGQSIKSRPYLFKFLDELSATYEIILFSNINDSHVFY